jgi:hypothetical protein
VLAQLLFFFSKKKKKNHPDIKLWERQIVKTVNFFFFFKKTY